MSNTSETPISYKGWTIAPETDPWGIAYGFKFVYFQDENVRGAYSIEEAKSEIDERIAEQENKNPNPYKEQIYKLEDRRDALHTAIKLLVAHEYNYSAPKLIEMRDEIAQQINDLQIDANTLPFPEK